MMGKQFNSNYIFFNKKIILIILKNKTTLQT